MWQWEDNRLCCWQQLAEVKRGSFQGTALAHSRGILCCCTSHGAKEYCPERVGAGALILLLFHRSKSHFTPRLSWHHTGQKSTNGRKDIFSLKIRLPEHWTLAATLIPVTTTGNSLSVLVAKTHISRALQGLCQQTSRRSSQGYWKHAQALQRMLGKA